MDFHKCQAGAAMLIAQGHDVENYGLSPDGSSPPIERWLQIDRCALVTLQEVEGFANGVYSFEELVLSHKRRG